MDDHVNELREWLDKYLTHSTRFRGLMLSLATALVEKQEWHLLVDLGECMTDTGEDIIELMKILQQHAAKMIVE